MKWMKYTGLYFIIFTIGYGLLKFLEVNDLYMCMFITGNCLYYCANLWREDS